MADLRFMLSVDSSGAEQGFERAERAVNRYSQSIRNVEQQYEKERNAQREMPGFYENLSSNGISTVHGVAGVNENLRAYNDLSLRIQELTNQIIKSNDIQKDAIEKGDMKKAYETSSAINQMEQERARLEMQKEKDEEGNESDILKSLRNGKIVDYALKGVEAVGQYSKIGSQYRMAVANGDYVGAEIGQQESLSGMAKGLGGMALGIGATLSVTGAGAVVGIPIMALGGLAEVLGIWGEADAAKKRADNAEASVYQNTLSFTNAMNKRFVSGEGTTRQTDAIRNLGYELVKDTGLTNEQFINAAIEMTRYGATSYEGAMQQARKAALWANATGADLGSVQNFVGMADRYGINSDTSYLAGARYEMGLQKGQTDEFLNALQSVIEDGIKNGYIKSTEDVSQTMTMLYRLSGDNQLWTGEQGAARLKSLNSGIAGATALRDVSQIMTVNVAKEIVDGKSFDWDKAFRASGLNKTGTYVDYMLMTERGLSPEMFAGIGNSIHSFEGGNIAGRIERWKQISGLNYSGALMLDQMYQGMTTEERDNPELLKKKIDKLKEDYSSEETKLVNKTNGIEKAVAEIGESKFWDNIKTIDKTLADYIQKEQMAEKEKKRMGDDYGKFVSVATGDEMAAVDSLLSALNPAGGMGDLPAGLGGTTYRDLKTKKAMQIRGHSTAYIGGNDEYDELFKGRLAAYAVLDDGKISQGELQKALREHDSKEMQKLYNNNTPEAYAQALERMFARLFNGGIVLNAKD